MNIHEYQSKAILKSYGVNVPEGYPAFSAEEAGENAKKLHISSTMSLTGHMLGAAGAAEAIACVAALNRGMIPPTINLKEPDPELDLDYPPNVPVKAWTGKKFWNNVREKKPNSPNWV